RAGRRGTGPAGGPRRDRRPARHSSGHRRPGRPRLERLRPRRCRPRGHPRPRAGRGLPPGAGRPVRPGPHHRLRPGTVPARPPDRTRRSPGRPAPAGRGPGARRRRRPRRPDRRHRRAAAQRRPDRRRARAAPHGTGPRARPVHRPPDRDGPPGAPRPGPCGRTLRRLGGPAAGQRGQPGAGHLRHPRRGPPRGRARRRHRHELHQRHRPPPARPATGPSPARLGCAGGRRRGHRARCRRHGHRRPGGGRGVSTRRQPAPPPELPGYTAERLLGSGGFADVYLYTQHLPRRQVAIKVLTHEAAEGQSREQFVAEANLMAQLSTHSSIVTIYHADTAADGRPYLVMQYCPLPNLAERVKVRPLGVPEVLAIGVRLAGAVETAHRAGIVHRDIKPANILTTEYGRPALTDFGIAGLTGAAESGGVSLPWAPPEAVEGQSAGVPGDVYSLAATLYTLLAGRSPFARPGANSRLDFTMRIKRDPVPPIGRTDVPTSLEELLARAMAKNPSARPASALELARALQVVEQELRLAMTDIEVPDTSWLAPASASAGADDEGRTVVRAVTEVDPTGAAPPPRPEDDEPQTVLRPVRAAGWEPEDD